MIRAKNSDARCLILLDELLHPDLGDELQQFEDRFRAWELEVCAHENTKGSHIIEMIQQTHIYIQI